MINTFFLEGVSKDVMKNFYLMMNQGVDKGDAGPVRELKTLVLFCRILNSIAIAVLVGSVGVWIKLKLNKSSRH